MDYFDLKDDYRNIILIDEYDGKVSLIMGELGKEDGTPYKRWGKLKVGKDKYTKKDIPWKVTLGTPDQAVEALKHFLNELGAPVSDIDGSDIPF